MPALQDKVCVITGSSRGPGKSSLWPLPRKALDLDEGYFARCFDTEDRKEGMAAFAEKRKPEFRGR